MESQQNQEPEVESREDAPFGSTKGEMISMVPVGLMVNIASACVVIW